MIRPLRQRHRHIFLVLSILLPIGLGLALTSRSPAPTMETLPPDLLPGPACFIVIKDHLPDFFSNPAIRTSLLRETPGGRFALGFSFAGDFVKPDLLAYWAEGKPPVEDRIPDDARLLGQPGSANARLLPAQASGRSGVIILYSLADNEIIAVSRPLELPPS